MRQRKVRIARSSGPSFQHLRRWLRRTQLNGELRSAFAVAGREPIFRWMPRGRLSRIGRTPPSLVPLFVYGIHDEVGSLQLLDLSRVEDAAAGQSIFPIELPED